VANAVGVFLRPGAKAVSMADAGGFIEWVMGESEGEALVDLRRILVGGLVGAIAGGLGTLAFSALLALAVVLGAFEPTQFGELAGLAGIGDPIVGEGNPRVGFAMFVAGGMTTWPFLFASLHHYLPGWRMAASGITFAAIGWSGFAIAFYSGQTGVSLLLFLVLTFVGQCLYGLVLGLVFEYAEPRVDVAFVGTTFQ